MNIKSLLTSLTAAVAITVPAGAVSLDLTALTSSGEINGAGFIRADAHSTGSGVIESFVRIQDNGVADGYNASARPVMPDVNTSATFTRDILLSDIPIVTNPYGGLTGSFYEFLLDINQTSANPLLSMDKLQIYTRATALSSAGTLADLTASGATLQYDLDSGSDSEVLLNYSLNSGSGSGDLRVYIPTFSVSGNPYVYLYSMFGAKFDVVTVVGYKPNDQPITETTTYSENDGFEEWAVRNVSTPSVPESGTTVIFLGMALAGLACLRRK